MYMRNQFMAFKDMFNGLRSISEMNIHFFFVFLQELKDKYEITKQEVQVKEVVSKDDIQELLVKPSKEFSHYKSFVQKFMVDMDEFKECNLTLDVKKERISNSREKRIIAQHNAWRKYFQNKLG